MMERRSEQSKKNRVCNSNLPHTGSATGSGRAEHSGEEEVVSVWSKRSCWGGRGPG